MHMKKLEVNHISKRFDDKHVLQDISISLNQGELDANRWASFYNWLNENHLLAEDIDPQHGFTNAYLPE